MPENNEIWGSNYNYRNVFQEMDDKKLKDVLKKRKLYQDEAANIAIEEAIRRAIINSEEELFAPEYQYEPNSMGLFPKIETSKNRNKIRKSIARSLLLAGILPTIWGVLQLRAGYINTGFIILLFGIIWMSLSGVLVKKFVKYAVYALLGLLFCSIFYFVSYLMQIPQLVFMDLLISGVSFILVLYGLLFLLQMHKGSEVV